MLPLINWSLGNESSIKICKHLLIKLKNRELGLRLQVLIFYMNLMVVSLYLSVPNTSYISSLDSFERETKISIKIVTQGNYQSVSWSFRNQLLDKELGLERARIILALSILVFELWALSFGLWALGLRLVLACITVLDF